MSSPSDPLHRPMPPVEVFYDGACPLCQQSRAWTERRAGGERVRFHDFRRLPDDELPVSRGELEGAMWVRSEPEGLLAGFDAWRRILSEVPGWRWLAVVTGIPPLSWIGPAAYRLVARYRHHLPIPFPSGCRDASCPVGERNP